MLNEQDASRLWQRLFRGQTVTSLTLAEAALVLEAMPAESPLRQRYTVELDELRARYQTNRLAKKGS